MTIKSKVTQNLDFSGHNFYVGIDVHKKEWAINIHTDDYEVKQFVQPADPFVLINHLSDKYPNATFYSVYEAGFSGFWVHDILIANGINNIVVNPSDIPTTDKEKKNKTDKIDARKLAKSLRAKQLKPIYIPDKEIIEERLLLRQRKALVKDITRCKNRIKTKLNFLGIKIPKEYDKPYWSKAFKSFLREDASFTTPYGRVIVNVMLNELENTEKSKKILEKEILQLSKVKYCKQVTWLRSIPGIGLLGAMTIITEIIDINRFENLDRLYSYIGLVPNCHSTGDKDYTGRITQRCNQYLRPILLQAAWRAVKVDTELLCSFMELSRNMKKNKAIIRIARKLVSRASFVLKNEKTLN